MSDRRPFRRFINRVRVKNSIRDGMEPTVAAISQGYGIMCKIVFAVNLVRSVAAAVRLHAASIGGGE